MEDMEDLLVAGGVIPGFRVLLAAAVGVNHRHIRKNRSSGSISNSTSCNSSKIPGTQVFLSCTVKSPSQSAMDTLIAKYKSAKKRLVVAGCVPQGSRDLKELDGVSIVGVQQIDRVVEVVEETLKGHEVRLLTRKTLPALDRPKVGRVRTVIADGVREIWLSSEDTGAYVRDVGVSLPLLFNSLVSKLPPDGSTMLRIGMTNPPYILEHLKEIAEVLRHPCVYSFLHVPVQSGSDSILSAMNREYTVSEFRTVVDTLIKLVPGMQIVTDVICGFPGIAKYLYLVFTFVFLIENFWSNWSNYCSYDYQQVKLMKILSRRSISSRITSFPPVHISQFYSRPGTPAARMKKVPSNIVKKRSRELTAVFESFTPYIGMESKIERIWITDVATDGTHLVGHTKGYIQLLVVGVEYWLIG
ncbi:uncharacterized protein [Primulina eburnea]|uniref:uncharacterized protein n=1 Tax=Primulina eburnea TaxID=1245227 RepID=UPI003C6BE76F